MPHPCLAFLGDELATDFRRAQTGIQARCTKLWVGLALAIDDGGDIGEQARQVVFRTRPRAQNLKGTENRFYRFFVPQVSRLTQFAFRLPLAAWSQFFDRSCMKSQHVRYLAKDWAV